MAVKSCPECGFPLKGGEPKCPECGFPLVESTPPQDNAPQTPPIQEHTHSEPIKTEDDSDYKTFSELFWGCEFYKILKGKHFDLGQRTYEFGVFLWEMVVLAWRDTWDKFAEFTGRATRREYWSFYFGWLLMGQFTLGIMWVIGLIPFIAVSIRRMHDTNHCGWWSCVPFACFFLELRKSDATPNRYGNPQ